MTTRIEKEFTFDAGHRLLDYSGKCAHLHGHTYHCFVELQADDLDKDGFVEDFGVVKGLCKAWVDTYLDHAFIFNQNDPLVEVLRDQGEKRIFTMEGNPTAENMARMLHGVFSRILGDHYEELREGGMEQRRVVLTKVTLFETPTSKAEYVEGVVVAHQYTTPMTG